MSRLRQMNLRPGQRMLAVFVMNTIVLGFLLCLPAPPTQLNAQQSSRSQAWLHVSGNCDAALQGAVLGLPSTGCGGNTTSFDSQQIYAPAVLKDSASPAAPCPGIANGAICFRMWYVGEDASKTPRIGLAVSPDGKNWVRVPGAGTGGSTFDLGADGSFDSQGVSYLTVIKDAGSFKMWYSGYGAAQGLDLTEGIGYATSSDGRQWTRISGPLQGGAVLRASGKTGAFDQHEAYVPFVIKDLATSSMPCGTLPLGASCYRMWYEGANTSAGYRFLIGYAVSGDGIHWTRVAGSGSGGAALDRAMTTSFDDNAVGIAQLIKEGAFLRMWYEAKNFNPGTFSIGHVSSEDGLSWIRPTAHAPVFTGADDPATPDPDYIWSHSVLKDGASYHMWYAMSIRPGSTRIGYAHMTPGTAMQASLNNMNGGYELRFITTKTIPAGSAILITPPAGIDLQPGIMQGFDALAQATLSPAAITDAPAAQVAREAIVIRLQNAEPPGTKSIQLHTDTTLLPPSSIIIQSFAAHEVLEYNELPVSPIDIITPTPLPDAKYKTYLPLVSSQ